MSIYRPSEQRFYIINKLGENDGGLGAADFSFIFGNPGDKPFTGDFDGDGVTEVGLHRESTGFVYHRNTLTKGNAHNAFFFGNRGDRFVAGDWSDADISTAAVKPDTPAIFRPGDATFYFRDSNSQGNATAALPFGNASFLPVAGDTGADPLVVNPPPRPPSPGSPTSFDCFNPIGLNALCGGDTDPADGADEAWVCLFIGTPPGTVKATLTRPTVQLRPGVAGDVGKRLELRRQHRQATAGKPELVVFGHFRRRLGLRRRYRREERRKRVMGVHPHGSGTFMVVRWRRGSVKRQPGVVGLRLHHHGGLDMHQESLVERADCNQRQRILLQRSPAFGRNAESDKPAATFTARCDHFWNRRIEAIGESQRADTSAIG